MTKRLLALALLALSLTACGLSEDTKNGESVETSNDYSVNIQEVKVNGKPLFCIRSGHGLSCDWVRYHSENPK
jgi:hypothetical protein